LACLLACSLLAAGCESATTETTKSPTPDSEPSATGTSAATTPSVTAAPTTNAGLPDGLTPARVTRVVDGDTIEVEIDGTEYTVRYIGIDTPETVHPSQPVGCFGPEASARNKALVEGKTVGLERDVSDTDRFGRLLRYVYVDGEMVNAALVRDGYAQSSTYPPDVKHQDTFIELQRQARESGRGLWGGICTTTPPAGAPGPGGECLIKGNISTSSGERIYHVPGQQYYDETVISEEKGERWFCTEQEAIDAGWRKARV
jgi:micrococcal nuclease